MAGIGVPQLGQKVEVGGVPGPQRLVAVCGRPQEQIQARVAELGLSNVEFECRDLSDFATTADAGAFDMITTFDAVHDQAKPFAV